MIDRRLHMNHLTVNKSGPLHRGLCIVQRNGENKMTARLEDSADFRKSALVIGHVFENLGA